MGEVLKGEEIIDYLKAAASPKTLDSIAEAFDVSKFRAERIVDELLVGNRIVEYVPDNKNSARKYYTVPEMLQSIELAKPEMKNDIVQKTVNVKDQYQDLEEKMEQIDGNVNNIYANMISMMSIFVAIFALITVNANITFELAQENTRDIFIGIVVMNLFVAICIVALLTGVKKVLINPMLEKKK